MNNSVFEIHLADDVTAVLTLNRPDKRNSLTIELMTALCEQIGELEADDSRRVLILRGAGPVFCAGLDLVEAADENLAEQSAHWISETLQALQNSALVTIAAVHGAAYAGGAGLMAACDFVVASNDLRVCFPEVRRGLVPALVSVVLRSRVSESALRELFLLAEPIDVERTATLGLVDRIASNAEVLDEAHCLARTITKGAPEAIELTKQLLTQSGSAHVSSLFKQALDVHTKARHSAEAKEGLKAFHERRDPQW